MTLIKISGGDNDAKSINHSQAELTPYSSQDTAVAYMMQQFQSEHGQFRGEKDRSESL